MSSNRATAAIGQGEVALYIAIKTPARGRHRAKGRARSWGLGAAPSRDYNRGISPKIAIEPRQKQVPHKLAATLLFQDTLLKVFGVSETLGQTGSLVNTFGASQTRVEIQPLDQQQVLMAQVQVEQPLVALIIDIPLVAAFIDEEQRRLERFRKVDPPQFQGVEGRGCT